jgi:hypothetical protein
MVSVPIGLKFEAELLCEMRIRFLDLLKKPTT